MVGFTKGLIGCPALEQTVLMQLLENILRDLGVLLGRRSSEYIKSNPEPFIYFGVDLVVFLAKLLGCDLLFKSFGLGRSAVLISAADVKGRAPSGFIVSSSGQKLVGSRT